MQEVHMDLHRHGLLKSCLQRLCKVQSPVHTLLDPKRTKTPERFESDSS